MKNKIIIKSKLPFGFIDMEPVKNANNTVSEISAPPISKPKSDSVIAPFF